MRNISPEVTLLAEYILGAIPPKLYKKQTVFALCSWLLCRDIKTPTPGEKKQFVDRCV